MKEEDSFPAHPPMAPLDFILTLEGVCRSFSLEETLKYGNLFIHGAVPAAGSCFIAQSGVLVLDVPPEGEAPDSGRRDICMEIARNSAVLWSQEYRDIGGEAVIEKKYRREMTPPKGGSIIRLVPKKDGHGSVFFEIYILNKKGELCEYGRVHLMSARDTSPHQETVPTVLPDRLLEKIREHCTDASIVELETVSPGAEQTLSTAEQNRISVMKGKRIRSFLAARLALKTLSRRISNNDFLTIPGEINTVLPDRRPVCPALNGENGPFCSVSHDRRFAIAVVSPRPVGVDVEEISKRLISPRRFYENEREKERADTYSAGVLEALARIWTLKEALSKALNISLPEIWARAEVHSIGPERSVYTLDNQEGEAFHITDDGHLFTLVHG